MADSSQAMQMLFPGFAFTIPSGNRPSENFSATA